MSLHARDESLMSHLSATHDGIFLIDRRRTYVFFNPSCERITGYSADAILGAQCTYGDVVIWRDKHGRVLSGVLCPTRALFDGTRDAGRQRMELTRQDGRRCWVDTHYTALRDHQGKVDYILGVVHELTADDISRSPQSVDDTSHDLNEGGQVTRKAYPDSNDIAASTGGSATAPSNGSLLLDKHLEDVERQAILKALVAAGWQRNKAAELMGISRSRLYRRMEALGIDPNAKM